MGESAPGDERFRKLEREIFDAFEAPGDGDTIDRLYGEDFLSINADGSTSDKTETVETVEAGRFPVSESVSNGESRVRRFGDAAVVTGRSKWTTEEMTVDVRHTQIWAKQDDRWRLVGWQGTPVNEGSGAGPDA